MSTQSTNFLKAFATDQTGSSFTAKTPTATKPSGDGVVELPIQGGFTDNLLVVKPYGSDANNEVFNFQAWGWQLNQTASLWEPCLIYEATCTLGNIARGSNFFDCDTLADVAGDVDTTRVVSPGSDKGGGYVVIDHVGFPLIEFEVAVSTAATGNLLYKLIS